MPELSYSVGKSSVTNLSALILAISVAAMLSSSERSCLLLMRALRSENTRSRAALDG